MRLKGLFIKSERKPDFLIAGAQKAGTSALDNYLRRHPDIGMAQVKEVHFFNNDQWFRTIGHHYLGYESLFDFKSGAKIYGEATPDYIYWEPSCQRIWTYHPGIKLVFVLRNPIERAFSSWNMEYDRKMETRDFSYCIRHEDQRLKAALPQQSHQHAYVDRGFYAGQIRRFMRFFYPEQMLFVKYEDFKTNQEIALKKILRFLGVDPDKMDYSPEIVHQREKHALLTEPDKAYLRELYEYDIRQVERLLGWDCRDWLES